MLVLAGDITREGKGRKVEKGEGWKEGKGWRKERDGGRRGMGGRKGMEEGKGWIRGRRRMGAMRWMEGKLREGRVGRTRGGMIRV